MPFHFYSNLCFLGLIGVSFSHKITLRHTASVNRFMQYRRPNKSDTALDQYTWLNKETHLNELIFNHFLSFLDKLRKKASVIAFQHISSHRLHKQSQELIEKQLRLFFLAFVVGPHRLRLQTILFTLTYFHL